MISIWPLGLTLGRSLEEDSGSANNVVCGGVALVTLTVQQRTGGKELKTVVLETLEEFGVVGERSGHIPEELMGSRDGFCFLR